MFAKRQAINMTSHELRTVLEMIIPLLLGLPAVVKLMMNY
jgi:hypothetical protein